jgi:hypothetical protein
LSKNVKNRVLPVADMSLCHPISEEEVRLFWMCRIARQGRGHWQESVRCDGLRCDPILRGKYLNKRKKIRFSQADK